MLENSTLITLTNRSSGSVGYTIPDMGNLHRRFSFGESKQVTMEEVRKLSYLNGGMYMLKHLLVMDNPEAIKEILHVVEPEYYYTDEQIKKLLEEGTYEEFLDCLDFAPEGVLRLVKDVAVKCEINDVRKRKAILDKLGFDVTKAIEFNRMTKESDGIEEEAPKRRRVSQPSMMDTPSTEETPTRRTTPKYNVTKRG